MAKVTSEMIVKLFKDAREAAASVERGGDAGTCNLDSASVKFPRGVTEETVKAALKEAGLNGYRSSSKLWRGCWIISPPFGGQGFYRTAQAEAMEKVFEAAGYTSAVYYQID